MARTETFFRTQFSYIAPEGTVIDPESIVDDRGYLPVKQRVDRMIRAGERLMEYRREHYDYAPEEEDDGEFMDPLRSYGLDWTDIQSLQQESLDRIRARSHNIRKAPKDDKPAKSDDGKVDVVTDPPIDVKEPKDG